MSESLNIEPGVKGLKHDVGTITYYSCQHGCLAMETIIQRPKGRHMLEPRVAISVFGMLPFWGIQLIFSDSSDCMMV